MKRPSRSGAGLWLAAALVAACLASGCLALALVASCSTFKADTIPALAQLCEQYAPCEPCPPAPALPVPPAPGEAPTLPPGNSTAPAPNAGTPAGPVDEIDPAAVTWDEPAGNVGAWPITATLSAAAMTADGMTAVRSPGWEGWPRRNDGGPKPTIGNWWIIARCRDGRWHGATIEWLGPTKTKATGKHWRGGDDLHGCIGTDFRAVPGEEVGIMQSGCARAGAETVKERTQIVKVRVPGE